MPLPNICPMHTVLYAMNQGGKNMGRQDSDFKDKHGNSGFSLVVVLFILLIIIGSAYVGNRSGGHCGYGGGYGY